MNTILSLTYMIEGATAVFLCYVLIHCIKSFSILLRKPSYEMGVAGEEYFNRKRAKGLKLG